MGKKILYKDGNTKVYIALLHYAIGGTILTIVFATNFTNMHIFFRILLGIATTAFMFSLHVIFDNRKLIITTEEVIIHFPNFTKRNVVIPIHELIRVELSIKTYSKDSTFICFDWVSQGKKKNDSVLMYVNTSKLKEAFEYFKQKGIRTI